MLAEQLLRPDISTEREGWFRVRRGHHGGKDVAFHNSEAISVTIEIGCRFGIPLPQTRSIWPPKTIAPPARITYTRQKPFSGVRRKRSIITRYQTQNTLIPPHTKKESLYMGATHLSSTRQHIGLCARHRPPASAPAPCHLPWKILAPGGSYKHFHTPSAGGRLRGKDLSSFAPRSAGAFLDNMPNILPRLITWSRVAQDSKHKTLNTYTQGAV